MISPQEHEGFFSQETGSFGWAQEAEANIERLCLSGSREPYTLLLEKSDQDYTAVIFAKDSSRQTRVETAIERSVYESWIAHASVRRLQCAERSARAHSFEQLHMFIEQLRCSTDLPVIVGLAGPSGGGKTTVGRLLADHYGPKARLLSLDDYYRGKTALKTLLGADHIPNWDDPISYDMAHFASDIQQLAQGNAIFAPRFNMPAGEPFDSRAHIAAPGTGDVVIAEGLYALHRDIQTLYSVTVFIDAPFATRLGRRIERDAGGRSTWSSQRNLRYCLEVAEPTFRQHGAPQRHAAQFYIETHTTT